MKMKTEYLENITNFGLDEDIRIENLIKYNIIADIQEVIEVLKKISLMYQFSGSKVINAGTGSIIEVTHLNGYLPTHYRNTSDLTRGLENSFFRGSKNTSATTLDGSEPIETFVSNPNTLTVNRTGRNTSEPILEVE